MADKDDSSTVPVELLARFQRQEDLDDEDVWKCGVLRAPRDCSAEAAIKHADEILNAYRERFPRETEGSGCRSIGDREGVADAE